MFIEILQNTVTPEIHQKFARWFENLNGFVPEIQNCLVHRFNINMWRIELEESAVRARDLSWCQGLAPLHGKARFLTTSSNRGQRRWWRSPGRSWLPNRTCDILPPQKSPGRPALKISGLSKRDWFSRNGSQTVCVSVCNRTWRKIPVLSAQLKSPPYFTSMEPLMAAKAGRLATFWAHLI